MRAEPACRSVILVLSKHALQHGAWPAGSKRNLLGFAVNKCACAQECGSCDFRQYGAAAPAIQALAHSALLHGCSSLTQVDGTSPAAARVQSEVRPCACVFVCAFATGFQSIRQVAHAGIWRSLQQTRAAVCLHGGRVTRDATRVQLTPGCFCPQAL